MLRKIFGSKNDREIKRLRNVVTKINELEASLSGLSDEQLQAKTVEFRERVSKGETLEQILPESFAVVREASKRVLKMRHFDVQLIGGIALFEGNISEMKTGEGKTLTATCPLYLRALAGKGAHLVTVNDYLARRDSEWMGKIYNFLGLSVGNIIHGLTDTQRRAAYASDITYGTNNEFGFDYLRDNMKTNVQNMVQRGHYFAIVDEVDSILIDEARTPLIISGPTETNTEIYYKVNAAIPGLHKDSDYVVDEKSNVVALTEDGINKLEKRLRVENLYDPRSIDFLHHVQQALKAHVLFKKDVDYVVKDNKVVIVDEHTGRLMPGRRYSDGLHGSLEAKENLRVEQENQTLATITFQNLFRMYETLSGMTGTADTEAVEFKKIYELDVVTIPTNRNMTRKDQDDVIYRTAIEKFNVIADEIAKRQVIGQPILVGTVSVEKSELLSNLLRRRNIPHEVLNAKNHAREADIIRDAGLKGHVTIATNMAGRGTDIVLGEGVRELGGLCVIGTERHESRRIDNQLRGRSGRQGDPGESIFYLSLEDDLMRIFASDRLSAIMQRLGMKEGESIVSPMVTRAIERAQRRVEEQNFSSRKHLLEYDDVMNQQRKIIYSSRFQLLTGGAEIEFIPDITQLVADRICNAHSPESKNSEAWDFAAVGKEAGAEFNRTFDLSSLDAKNASVHAVADTITEQVTKAYSEIQTMVSKDIMKQVECYVYLQIIDQSWKDHLLQMDHLKDSVSLRGYAQRDPLQEYKKEGFRLFEEMMLRIETETALSLLRMPPPTMTTEQPVQVEAPDESKMNFNHPAAAPTVGSPSSSSAPGQNATARATANPRQQEGRSSGSNQNNTSDDGMIYHGPRSAPQQRQANVVPVKRVEPKVGRNDDCPCGSGKKYKKCHGKSAEQADQA
jgi:preprotein translocase subunit SecA